MEGGIQGPVAYLEGVLRHLLNPARYAPPVHGSERQHLVYNTLVFIPMVVAMYYHVFPDEHDAAGMRCSCALRSHLATT
jgi:hypothetical protein